MRRTTALLAVWGWLALAGVAAAEIVLPPGFTAEVYVSGQGFATAMPVGGGRGVPSIGTLAVDATGTLYMARTGRRYTGGDAEDHLSTIQRVPAGGARLSPDTLARHLYGPPLPNPQVAAVRSDGELLVTTHDRDRKIGVLYRVVDGHAEILAGGTPEPGQAPVLVQPEGVAVDRAGHLYVADRARGVVVKLAASGRLLDPRWLTIPRPRVVAVDDDDAVWVGSDGPAEAPWQRGPGEIWRVAPESGPRRVLRGPLAVSVAAGPAGRLYVADRHGGRVFVLTPDGERVEFASFTDSDAPRAIRFVPVTDGTRRAGLAGDLLVVTIRRGAWPVNEVVRISGPFDRFGGR